VTDDGIKIKDVPLWRIYKGIGHIVMVSQDSWISTACNIMTPNGIDTKEIPKRKCRKCMTALPKLKIVKTIGYPLGA